MKANIPISDLTCDSCRVDIDHPYESHAPYTMVAIELFEGNNETFTVPLDVKKISWQEKGKGRYTASAVISIICPYCKNSRDLRHQLEAPSLLLKEIGICKTCGGSLSLENESIEYSDGGEAGPTIAVQGDLVCRDCTKRERKSLEISSPALPSLVQSESIEMDFTGSGIKINNQDFATQTNRSGVIPKTNDRGFVGKTSILFLAADPTDASRLRLGEEFREIQEKLKLAHLRDRFKLELPQLSIRPVDIAQALLDTQPQIVHFSGHGASTGALCFENQMGQIHLVQPDALAALFEQFAHQVNCVLLNACYSETQAKTIAEHIEYVIGMNQSIGDRAAIAFTIGFYQALGAGRTIEDAYKLGCVQIRLQGIPEHLTPVLIKKEQAHP